MSLVNISLFPGVPQGRFLFGTKCVSPLLELFVIAQRLSHGKKMHIPRGGGRGGSTYYPGFGKVSTVTVVPSNSSFL